MDGSTVQSREEEEFRISIFRLLDHPGLYCMHLHQEEEEEEEEEET